MHCKQVGREKLPFSKVGRSPENYLIYICRKSCKHVGPNFRITLYTGFVCYPSFCCQALL
ncbi:hypothetical protein T02_2617 [Trichinella nativa]|uniref:Uncharacterized protein n=1 Tax=Trichinella nativa TaxID=6335 RepID=A0A0V1KSY1_9BILA|nr:hypothetical protein T02_2617 [Trichinella nativa]